MFLKLFPIWVFLAAIAGFLFPGQLSLLQDYIIPLLTIVMLCMGLTLKPSDFLTVARYKTAILAGVVLQFTVMPLSALLIASLFNLNQPLTVGLVLLGSVAGGTSSNVMTYLAGGHVALSVSMTAISTLLSVIMTPLLLVLLTGSEVEIPAKAILISLVKVILFPVILGLIINTCAHRWVDKIKPGLAPLSILTILLIIAIVVALNADRISNIGALLALATLLHNTTGLILGYLAAHLLGFDKKISRTIAIEVGMQNSGLATALALKFFSPVSALPGAIFSIWLNITGAIFASICLRFDKESKQKMTKEQSIQARINLENKTT